MSTSLLSMKWLCIETQGFIFHLGLEDYISFSLSALLKSFLPITCDIRVGMCTTVKRAYPNNQMCFSSTIAMRA